MHIKRLEQSKSCRWMALCLLQVEWCNWTSSVAADILPSTCTTMSCSNVDMYAGRLQPLLHTVWLVWDCGFCFVNAVRWHPLVVSSAARAPSRKPELAGDETYCALAFWSECLQCAVGALKKLLQLHSSRRCDFSVTTCDRYTALVLLQLKGWWKENSLLIGANDM